MSSPEYAERRGLNGNLVTARCSLLLSARKRSLIYFIQALSHREGGVQKIASELIEMFPERLGTPVMHQLGIKADKIYSRDVLKKVDHDLICGLMLRTRDDDEEDDDVPFFREIDPIAELAMRKQKVNKKPIRGNYLIQACRSLAAEKLSAFLAEFCLNPKLRFSLPGEDDIVREFEDINSQKKDGENLSEDAEVVYFHDIVGALSEYKKRYVDGIRQKTVVTEIGRRVYEALEYASKSEGMVIIEGNARLGKTFAAKTWCDMNLGRARFVSVPCSNAEEDFYRAIAYSLGLPVSQKKNVELRDLIDKTLRPGHIMLVFDEAHFLWPQKNVRVANPVRLNWIRTELVDKGIAVALITTPQAWKNDRTRTIKNTGWACEQFEGRVAYYERLPVELSVEDLKAVAKSMFPSLDNASMKFLAGMAMTTREYLGALSAVARRARWYWAEKAGRSAVSFEDIDNAVKERMAIPNPQEHSQKALAKTTAKGGERGPCNKPADRLHRRFRATNSDTETVIPAFGSIRLNDQTPGRFINSAKEKEDEALIKA